MFLDEFFFFAIWMKVYLTEAGHADGDGAQPHDDVLEALRGLVDTLGERRKSARSQAPAAQLCGAADVIITFPREANIENRQIDRALAGTGIAQNWKTEKTMIVSRCPTAQSVHLGLRGVQKAKDFVVYLGSRLAWNLSFAHEKGARINAASSGLCRWAACGCFQVQCNHFKAVVR